CYTYDTVQRLNDSRFGSKKRNVDNVEDYITLGKLGQAFTSQEQVVLLIDEIDKADPEFPNDLLQELDIMEFYVNELQKTIKAIHRPIVIITSNNEKELPDEKSLKIVSSNFTCSEWLSSLEKSLAHQN
ncbi:MAG: AAA family ATPase, partial [Promethearchaeota archaeon]